MGITVMLTALFILILSINGGLYLGTITYSTYKSEEIGKAIDHFQQKRPFSGELVRQFGNTAKQKGRFINNCLMNLARAA